MKPKYALPFGYLSAVSNCSMSGVHEQLFPVICPRAAPSQLFGCKTVPTESTVSSRSPDAAFSRDLPTPPTASSPPSRLLLAVQPWPLPRVPIQER